MRSCIEKVCLVWTKLGQDTPGSMKFTKPICQVVHFLNDPYCSSKNGDVRREQNVPSISYSVEYVVLGHKVKSSGKNCHLKLILSGISSP